VADGGSLVSLTCGRTRSETVDHILHLLSVHPRTVVGFDFSFSFPRWWVAEHNMHPWELAVAFGESWLASCPPPFWGRPGRRQVLEPSLAYRRTELSLTPRPGSVFQIGGAGAVGTASLRGMPHLRRLAAAGVAVWPFVDWPASGPVAAEVWPRSVMGSVVKSSASARAAFLPAVPAAHRSPDAFDAACAALALSRWSGPVPRVDAVSRVEGSILVPR
jgi:hypothetical protein